MKIKDDFRFEKPRDGEQEKDLKLSKWGNSQGFRMPKSILHEIDADVSDKFHYSIISDEKGNKALVIMPVKQKRPTKPFYSKEEKLAAAKGLEGILSHVKEKSLDDLRYDALKEKYGL